MPDVPRGAGRRHGRRDHRGLPGGRMRRGFRKYRNQPTEIDGHRFASKAEARRYQELRLMERAGAIAELQLQPRFKLVVGEHHVCTYVADFHYLDIKAGVFRTEDVKGVQTPEFKLKAKLMKACLGIDVVLVTRKGAA